MNSELPEAQAFLATQDHLLHRIFGYIHLQGTPRQLDKMEGIR